MADLNPGADSLLALRRMVGPLGQGGPEPLPPPMPAAPGEPLPSPPTGAMEPLPTAGPVPQGLFVGEQADPFMSALQQQAGPARPETPLTGADVYGWGPPPDPYGEWRGLEVPAYMLELVDNAAKEANITAAEIKLRGGDWTEVFPEEIRESVHDMVQQQRASEAPSRAAFQGIPEGIEPTEDAIKDQTERNLARAYGDKAPQLGAAGMPQDPLAPVAERDLLGDRKVVRLKKTQTLRGALAGGYVGGESLEFAASDELLQEGLDEPTTWKNFYEKLMAYGQVADQFGEIDGLLKNADEIRRNAYTYYHTSIVPFSDREEVTYEQFQRLSPGYEPTKEEHESTESMLLEAKSIEDRAQQLRALADEGMLRVTGGDEVELAKQAVRSIGHAKNIAETGLMTEDEYLEEIGVTPLQYTLGLERSKSGQAILRKLAGVEDGDREISTVGEPYFLNEEQYQAVLRGETPLGKDAAISAQELRELEGIAQSLKQVRRMVRITRSKALNGDPSAALELDALYGLADEDDIEIRIEQRPDGLRQPIPRVKRSIAASLMAPLGPETEEERKARVEAIQVVRAGRTLLEVHPNPAIRRDFIKRMLVQTAPFSPSPYVYAAVQQISAGAGWDDKSGVEEFVRSAAGFFDKGGALIGKPMWNLAKDLGFGVLAGDPGQTKILETKSGGRGAHPTSTEVNAEKFRELVLNPESYEEARPLILEFSNVFPGDDDDVELGGAQDNLLRKGWEKLRSEFGEFKAVNIIGASGVVEKRLRRFANWEDTLYETGNQWARENFPDPAGLDSVRQLAHEEVWQTVDGRVVRGVEAIDNANTELKAIRSEMTSAMGPLVDAHYEQSPIVTEYLADVMLTGEDRYLPPNVKEMPVYKWAMFRSPTMMPLQISAPLVMALLDIDNVQVRAPKTDQDKLKAKYIKTLFHANLRSQAPDEGQVGAYIKRIEKLEGRVLTPDQARKRWLRSAPQWRAFYLQLMMEAALPQNERNGFWRDIEVNPARQTQNVIEFLKNRDIVAFSSFMAADEERRWFTRGGRQRIPLADELLKALRPKSLKYMAKREKRRPIPGKNIFEESGLPFDATLGPLTVFNLPLDRRSRNHLLDAGIIDLMDDGVLATLVNDSGAWLQQLDATGDPQFFDFAAAINRLPAKNHERLLKIAEGSADVESALEFWFTHVPVSANRALHGLKMFFKGTAYTVADVAQATVPWILSLPTKMATGGGSPQAYKESKYGRRLEDGKWISYAKPGSTAQEAMTAKVDPTYLGAVHAQQVAAIQDLSTRFGSTVPDALSEFVRHYADTYSDWDKYEDYWRYDPVPAFLDVMTAFQLAGAIKIPMGKTSTIDKAKLMAAREYRMGRRVTPAQRLKTRPEGYESIIKASMAKRDWVSIRELPLRFIHVIGDMTLNKSAWEFVKGKGGPGPKYGAGIVVLANTMELLNHNLPVIGPAWGKMGRALLSRAKDGTILGMTAQYFMNQSSYMSREMNAIITLGKKEVNILRTNSYAAQQDLIARMARAAVDKDRLPSIREIIRDSVSGLEIEKAVPIEGRVLLPIRRHSRLRSGQKRAPKTQRERLAEEHRLARQQDPGPEGLDTGLGPQKRPTQRPSEVWLEIEQYLQYIQDNFELFKGVWDDLNAGKKVNPDRVRVPVGHLTDKNHPGVYALNLEDLGWVNRRGKATKAFKKVMPRRRGEIREFLVKLHQEILKKDKRVAHPERLAARATEVHAMNKRRKDGTIDTINHLTSDIIEKFDSPQIVEMIVKAIGEYSTRGDFNIMMEGGGAPFRVYLRPATTLVKEGHDVNVVGDAAYRLQADIVRRSHKKHHAGIRIVSRSGSTEGVHVKLPEGSRAPQRLAVSVDAAKVFEYFDLSETPRYMKGSPWHSAIDEAIFTTPEQYLEFSEQIGREMIRNPRGQRGGAAYKKQITETVLERWRRLDSELPEPGIVRDKEGNILKLDMYDGTVTREAIRHHDVVGYTLEDLGLVHKQGKNWMPTDTMQYILERGQLEMRVMSGDVETVAGITGALNALKHMLRDGREPVFVSRYDLDFYSPKLKKELAPEAPTTGGTMRGARHSGEMTAVGLEDAARGLGINHTIATDNPALIDMMRDLFGDIQVRRTQTILENRATYDRVARPFATRQLDREFYAIYDPEGVPITQDRIRALKYELDAMRPRKAKAQKKKIDAALKEVEEGVARTVPMDERVDLLAAGERPSPPLDAPEAIVVTREFGVYETDSGLRYFGEPLDQLSGKLADEVKSKAKPLGETFKKHKETLEQRKQKIAAEIEKLTEENAKRAYVQVQKQIERLEANLDKARGVVASRKKNVRIEREIKKLEERRVKAEGDLAGLEKSDLTPEAKSAKSEALQANLEAAAEKLHQLRGTLEPDLKMGERVAKLEGELSWRYEVRDKYLLRKLGDEGLEGLPKWYVKDVDQAFPTLGDELNWLDAMSKKTDKAIDSLHTAYEKHFADAQVELPLVYGHVLDAVMTEIKEGRVFWGYDVRDNTLGRLAYAAGQDTQSITKVVESTERIMGQNKDALMAQLGGNARFRSELAAGADVSRKINMGRMHQNPMAAVHQAFAGLSFEERASFQYWVRRGVIPPMARKHSHVIQNWMDAGLVDIANGQPKLTPLGVLSTFFEIDNSTHFYQSALIRGILRDSQQFAGPAYKFFQSENYLPPHMAYMGKMLTNSLSDVQSGLALDWIQHINMMGLEGAPAAVENALTHHTMVYHSLVKKYLRAADPSDYLEKVVGHSAKIVNKTMAERYDAQAASGQVLVDVTPFEAALMARAELKQNMWRMEAVKQYLKEGFIRPGVKDSSGKMRAPGNPEEWLPLNLSELQGSKKVGATWVERFRHFGDALDPTVDAKTQAAQRKRASLFQELKNVEKQLLKHNELEKKFDYRYIFGDLGRAADTYYIRRTQAATLELTDSVQWGWAKNWWLTQQRFHLPAELRQAIPSKFAELSDVEMPGRLSRVGRWAKGAAAAGIVFPVTEAAFTLAEKVKSNPITRNFKVKKLFLSAMGPQTRNMMTNTMLTAELHPQAMMPGSPWWKYMKEYMTDYRNGIIKKGSYAEEAASMGIVQSGVSKEIGFAEHTRLSVVIDEWLSGVQKRADNYHKFLKAQDDAAYITHLVNDLAISHREAMLATELGKELMDASIAASKEATLQAPKRTIMGMIWDEVKQAQEAVAPVYPFQGASPTNRYLAAGKNWFNYTDDSFKYALGGYLYEVKGLRGQALYDAIYDWWPDYNNITKAERMYTLRQPFGVYETKYYQIMTRFMTDNPAYANTLIQAHTYMMANELSDPETLQAWMQIPSYKKWQVSRSPLGGFIDESMFSVMSNDRVEWGAFNNPIAQLIMALAGKGAMFPNEPGVGGDGKMYFANLLRTLTDTAYGSFQMNPYEAVSNLGVYLGNEGDVPSHWAHTAGDQSDWYRDIMKALAQAGGPRMNRLMASIVDEPYPIGANREPYSVLEAAVFSLFGLQQVKPEAGTFERAVRMSQGRGSSAGRQLFSLMRQANERVTNLELDRAPSFSVKQRLLKRAALRRGEAVMKMQELSRSLGLDQPGARRILDAAHRLALQGLTEGRISPGAKWNDEDYRLDQYRIILQEELDEQIMEMRRKADIGIDRMQTQHMRKPWRRD